jgi:hypothetical protein
MVLWVLLEWNKQKLEIPNSKTKLHNEWLNTIAHSFRIESWLQCDAKLKIYELLTTWYNFKKETGIDFPNCVELK